MNTCTCGISKTPCNTVFIYDAGKVVVEIDAHLAQSLKPRYVWLCAGAALQKLNFKGGK